MSTSATNSAATDQVTGELGRLEDVAPLAVEIYYYGVDEPTAIPLTGASDHAALRYFQNLKVDIIDAQRHSRRSLWIESFDRQQDAQRVAPLEIQRVILVKSQPTDEAVDVDEQESV